MLYYILLHVNHKATKHPPFLQTILRVFQLNVRGNGSWGGGGGLTLFYQFRIREFFRFLHVSSGRFWMEWGVVFLWSNQWTSIVFKRTCDSFTKTAVYIVQFYTYKSNYFTNRRRNNLFLYLQSHCKPDFTYRCLFVCIYS